MSIVKKKKVFVGLSGGVDSSVAAYLLKKQGYDVTGVFLRCWSDGYGPDAYSDGTVGVPVGVNCTSETDAEGARRVAEHIGIPFYVWDFEKEYKNRVVKYMVDGYRRGITPNPDVACNREIKFGLFLNKALTMGADYVATGHYVRLVACGANRKDKRYMLQVARDTNKDQSYFLWTLTQGDLAQCLFPVGNFVKSKVRAIAKRAGLPTALKKDSQGICFLGKVTLVDFLKNYIRPRRGAVVDVHGRKIGEHNGAYFYTLGQRHGIGAMKHEKGQIEHKPLYVAAKNVRSNTITMAGENDAKLYRQEIKLVNVNFINSSILNSRSSILVLARIRYRQPLARAKLSFAERTRTNTQKIPRQFVLSPRKSATLIFKTPQKFVAPGQSAVFYSSRKEMLGGGVII